MGVDRDNDQSWDSLDNHNDDYDYDYSANISDLDIKALDELVSVGFNPEQVSESVRERARYINQLLSLLDGYHPAEPPNETDEPESLFSSAVTGDLCDRTMAFIHEHDSRGRVRPSGELSLVTGYENISEWHNQDKAGRFSFERFQMRDVIGIAASIILLIGLVSPILAGARAEAQKQCCRSNMMSAGIGFTAYAADYQYALPVSEVVDELRSGGNWITSRANSANLFRLAKTGYTSLASLCCPGNSQANKCESLLQSDNWPDRASTSFSYQNLIASDRRAKWGSDSRIMVILSDRSPFIEAGPCGKKPSSIDANSDCHGPEGQNVLVSDGSGIWLTQSTFGDDNIWLPENLQKSCGSRVITLTGDEIPDDQWDTMLVQ